MPAPTTPLFDPTYAYYDYDFSADPRPAVTPDYTPDQTAFQVDVSRPSPWDPNYLSAYGFDAPSPTSGQVPDSDAAAPWIKTPYEFGTVREGVGGVYYDGSGQPSRFDPSARQAADPAATNPFIKKDTHDFTAGAVQPTVDGLPSSPGVASPLSGGLTPPQMQPLQSARQGGSASSSSSGYNPATHAGISNGVGSRLDRQMAADASAIAGRYDPTQRELDAASQDAMGAQNRYAAAEAEKIAQASVHLQAMAAAKAKYATDEAAAIAESQEEANAAKMDYRAALEDYRASRVNPAQLWESASGAGKFSMIASAFMHDFLGAKGIKTSAMDTINRAIQQNIDTQVFNINNKKEVASGFKTLWDMQRAQSATDAEARARVKGFFLDSLADELNAKMGTYDSRLAIAKSQSAVAELRKEAAKTKFAVDKHIDEAASEKARQHIQVYGVELQASMQRQAQAAALQQARLAAQAEQIKLQREALKEAKTGLIADTSASGQNVFKRRFLPDVSASDATKFREQTAKIANQTRMIQRLIDLDQQVGAIPPTDISLIKKVQGEQARAAQQVRDLLTNTIIYDNTGKAINENELKRVERLTAAEDWFTNGDTVRNLAILADEYRKKNEAVMDSVSVALSPGDPFYGVSTGFTEFDPAGGARVEVEQQEGSGRHKSTAVEDAYKRAVAPKAAAEPAEDPTNSIYSSWTGFQVGRGVTGGAGEPTEAFAGLATLAELAAGGDAKAAATLKDVSTGKAGDAQLREYADYLLSLGKNAGKKPQPPQY